MKTSDTLAKIAPAMVAASAEIEGAAKSANNSHFKSKYATLESVIDATRDALAKNELCVIQAPGVMTGNLLTMTTRLMHSSGEWIEAEYQIPLAKADPQASGSAITYARRYALMALLNVPAVDDDAEAAQGRGNQAQGVITEAQAKELEKLIETAQVKPDVVLASVGVKTLAQIPSGEFASVKAKLQARIAGLKKQVAPAPEMEPA